MYSTRLGSTRTCRHGVPKRSERGPVRDLPHAVALRLVGLEAVEHPAQNRLLDPFLGIAHNDLHQEAVELGLGQRIGALELDRVLRREDGEPAWERM